MSALSGSLAEHKDRKVQGVKAFRCCRLCVTACRPPTDDETRIALHSYRRHANCRKPTYPPGSGVAQAMSAVRAEPPSASSSSRVNLESLSPCVVKAARDSLVWIARVAGSEPTNCTDPCCISSAIQPPNSPVGDMHFGALGTRRQRVDNVTEAQQRLVDVLANVHTVEAYCKCQRACHALSVSYKPQKGNARTKRSERGRHSIPTSIAAHLRLPQQCLVVGAAAFFNSLAAREVHKVEHAKGHSTCPRPAVTPIIVEVGAAGAPAAT